MVRYIDAIILDEARFEKESSTFVRGWNAAIEAIIKSAPAADVVEVVRCRECKHKAEGQCYCYKHGLWLHRMTFCSEGERRADDDRNG